MITELCTCGWDIPGVYRLPPHDHHHRAKVSMRGRVFVINGRDLALNPRTSVLDDWHEIHMHVDWKEVARCLSRDPSHTPT